MQIIVTTLFLAFTVSCNSRSRDSATREQMGIAEPIPASAEYEVNALDGLLRLRTAENRAKLDPAIEYLSNVMCGRLDGVGAIDVESFYPMNRIEELHTARCGMFILRNYDFVCGQGPRDRGVCTDRPHR
jgi:hypothetical protein